ncbi:hypothetical protein HDV04_001347 [Boothiomyces sp. JEL0838]|nr:hypothetical protein HDV04_001347 [Boothiomyces sp. JEL0838]
MGKLVQKIKKLFKSEKKELMIDKNMEPTMIDKQDMYDVAYELQSRLSIDSEKTLETPSEKYSARLHYFEELPAYDDEIDLSDMKSIYSFYELYEWNRTLVLPVDNSPNSKYAVTWCKNHLFLKTDRISLVNIANTRLITEHSPLYLPNLTTTKIEDTKNQHADEQINLMNSFAEELKEFNVEYHVGVGDAKKDLLKFMESLQPDMIVIGQSKGFVSRVWKSVGDYIINNCKFPILLVRKK